MPNGISFFGPLLIACALIPAFTEAGAPEPPRNIRVVPMALGPCEAQVFEEGDAHVKRLMAIHGVNEQEGWFLHSLTAGTNDGLTTAEQSLRAKHIQQVFEALQELSGATPDMLSTVIAGIAEEAGLAAEDEAVGVALIQTATRNKENADKLKATLSQFDIDILKIIAIARGCNVRN